MVGIDKVLLSASWVKNLEQDVINAIRNNVDMTPEQLARRVLIEVYDCLNKSEADIKVKIKLKRR